AGAAPPDQPISVTHPSRLGLALRPTEGFCSRRDHLSKMSLSATRLRARVCVGSKMAEVAARVRKERLHAFGSSYQLIHFWPGTFFRAPRRMKMTDAAPSQTDRRHKSVRENI